ncbi:MAG: hypothetical protein LUC98_07970 [Lachnospiraceae bacterium]|nr:hypothetical protein [Lachnospiraceae bacterium]
MFPFLRAPQAHFGAGCGYQPADSGSGGVIWLYDKRIALKGVDRVIPVSYL